MLQDIKDEILSGDPRYTIRDSSGNVLNDNVDISLKTPIIQEGTPLNKAFFENFNSDISDYELLTYEQEDISEPTTSTIFGQLPSSISGNDTTINGYCSGNKDGNTWDFKIESDKPLVLSKEAVNGKTSISSKQGNSSYADASNINYNFRVGTYMSNYYVLFRYAYSLEFAWDFQKSVTPTFKFNVKASSDGSASLWVSDNGTDWTIIKTYTSLGSDQTYAVETPHRYFRFDITTTNSSASVYVYYMYFSNVGDSIKKIKNKFTSTNDFSKIKYKNVLVPSTITDFEYVTSNTLNGIDIDKILHPNMRYNIMLEDNKMVNGLGILHGVTGILSYNQSITLDFMPRLLFVQYSNNENKLVEPMQPTKTITNTGNGGSSSTTMSYCAFY